MGMARRVIVLWISGLTWDIVERMPSAAALRETGAVLRRLEPVPITGAQTQAYQLLTGKNPGKIGYVDDWAPRHYVAEPTAEPTAPTLDALITGAGRASTSVRLALADASGYLTGSPSSPPATDCLIVRTALGASLADADAALTAARDWAGDDGICMLLCDHHSAPVSRFVNLNDALHDVGILEIDRQDTAPRIRWDETLAYHVGHGQIWINLNGRESAGIVAARGEYERVAQALVEMLPSKVIDPATGEQVIERVFPREELYAGDYLFQAPDLVAVFRPGYAPSPNSVRLGLDGVACLPTPSGTSVGAGLHPSMVGGLAIVAGPTIATGQVIDQAPLTSIAPTLFHMLGLPVPLSLESPVITDCFDAAYLAESPVRRSEQDLQLSSEDEAEIMTRLRTLGYVG